VAEGTYNTVIRAERDLVRRFTWTNGATLAPIDLGDYTRLLYNLQTDTAVPVEVLIVDSSLPENEDWLFIESPPTGGIIKLEVPGGNVPYVHSDTGRWRHELVLFDENNGAITVFEGRVTLKRPVASLLDS
jgi:hypothetical protein